MIDKLLSNKDGLTLKDYIEKYGPLKVLEQEDDDMESSIGDMVSSSDSDESELKSYVESEESVKERRPLRKDGYPPRNTIAPSRTPNALAKVPSEKKAPSFLLNSF